MKIYIQPTTVNGQIIGAPLFAGAGEINTEVIVFVPMLAGYTATQSQLTVSLGTDDKTVAAVFTPNVDNPLQVQPILSSGKPIGEPIDVGLGETGKSTKLPTPHVPGYHPESKVVLFDVTVGIQTQPVTYLPNTDNVIKVVAIGPKGQNLASDNQMGVTGEELVVDALIVKGYEPTQMQQTINVSAGGNTVAFNYTATANNPIVIQPVKPSGEPLIDAITIMGKTGESLIIPAPKVPDYQPEESEVTIDAVVGGGMNVTMRYHPIRKHRILIQPKLNGKDFDEIRVVGMGAVGIPETVNIPKIVGYHVDDELIQVDIKKGDNIVDINYLPDNDNPITIQPVLADKQTPLGEPTHTVGTTKQPLQVKAPTLTGYVPVKPEVKVKAVPIGGMELTWDYRPKSEQLTVKFLDESEHEVMPSRVLEGKFAQAFSAVPMGIPDYETINNDPVSTTFDDDPKQSIVFHYRKQTTSINSNVKTVTVPILVQTLDGDPLQQAEISGPIGESYRVQAPDLEGYKVIGDSIQTGVYGDTTDTIIFVMGGKAVDVLAKRVAESKTEVVPGVTDPEFNLDQTITFDDDANSHSAETVGIVIVQAMTQEGEILGTNKFTGHVGTKYTLPLPQIDGYLGDVNRVVGTFEAKTITEAVVFRPLENISDSVSSITLDAQDDQRGLVIDLPEVNTDIDKANKKSVTAKAIPLANPPAVIKPKPKFMTRIKRFFHFGRNHDDSVSEA